MRLFVETIRTGKFTEAARRLRISQPNVTRAVKRIEGELGARLIERSRPTVVPTREGLALFSFAELTLGEFEKLRKTIGKSRETLHGLLYIISSTTPGEYLVPNLLVQFSRLHPGIDLQMKILNSDAVEECVSQGHCDIGFLGREPRTPWLDRCLIGEDEILLAIPAEHPLLSHPSVSISDLEGEWLVQREEGSGTRLAVETALKNAGLRFPRHHVAFVASTAQALLGAVSSGMGIGFVSSLALEGVDRRGVSAVRLRDLNIRRNLYMIYDANRCSEACRALVSYVENERGLTRPPMTKGPNVQHALT